MYIGVGCLSVIIVATLVGVLVTAQRKRAYGSTWFPENFFSNSNSNGNATARRKGPDGGEGEDPDSDCKLDSKLAMIRASGRCSELIMFGGILCLFCLGYIN